jgi:predicted nucleic acid-binding protein
LIAYFDTSALVKLVLDESGSDIVLTAWDGADLRVTSRFAFPELRAALAEAERDGRLSPADHRAVKRSLPRRASQIDVIELSPAVADAAGDLAERFALTGADAVHLASGLAVSEDEAIFLTWDRRLASGAAAAGLAVLPTP